VFEQDGMMACLQPSSSISQASSISIRCPPVRPDNTEWPELPLSLLLLLLLPLLLRLSSSSGQPREGVSIDITCNETVRFEVVGGISWEIEWYIINPNDTT
jgi:hypothetical protein